VRHFNLPAARKTLGQAIGACPKDKLFKGYISLETRLHEFSRCRTLYEKHIEFNPSNAQTWIRFAELEMALEDYDRVRAIFELAVDQELLDMPELLWKAYIDFEEESGEFDRVRGLFERLLEKTDHVKVWISYAHFEVNADEGEDEDTVSEETKARARRIFERAYKRLKEKELKEEVCPPLPYRLAETNDICSASHSSMLGKLSSKRTAPQKTRRRWKRRCPARSRSGESWTTTHTRNTWSTCSPPTSSPTPGSLICYRLLVLGSRIRWSQALPEDCRFLRFFFCHEGAGFFFFFRKQSFNPHKFVGSCMYSCNFS